MPSKRAERIVTISGKDGYIQVTEAEQKAFRIEVFFTATNVSTTNYYSYEWYKKKSLYGRIKIARGEYTSREKLVQHQNELVYAEEATLFEVVKRLQCNAFEVYNALEYMTQYIRKISTKVQASTNDENIPISAFIKPPKPISIPGLQIDGVYYNMLPGCAGRLVFQTWYDEDECKDKDGNPLTRDNRGKPPEPAFQGDPPKGTANDVPIPTFGPGTTYVDKDPLIDEPTDNVPNPGDPVGTLGALYTLIADAYLQPEGTFVVRQTITIRGKYGGIVVETPGPGLFRIGIYNAIGMVGSPPKGAFSQLSEGGRNPDGATRIRIQLISITPQ